MIPRSITAQHVEAALATLDRGGIPEGRASRKYDLIHGGRRYPPKLVVAMAAQAVIGRELTSEEFGGGAETNTFLEGLGFCVEEKSAGPPGRAPSPTTPPPAPAVPHATRAPSSPHTVALDRVWMDMGVSRRAFAERGDPWSAHKQIVVDLFTRDKARYLARIGALAEASAGRLLHLPACALVTGGGVTLGDYRFRPEVTVVAGRYDLDARRETLVVLRAGAVLEECDDTAVLAMDDGDIGLMIAISSTVGELAGGAPPRLSARAPWQPGKPVVILDSGHHPYSSRYLFNTLRCTADGARGRAGAPAVVVLSSWRYAHAAFTKNWCRPEARVAMPEHRACGADTMDRLVVSLAP